MSMTDATTYLDVSGKETLHELWTTPVITAKPFSKTWLDKFREDIKPILAGPGQFNHNDIWKMPEDELPQSMLELKGVIVELAEKYWRPYVEMPLPKFNIGKGYFREVNPGTYRISPHKHSMSLGVCAFYITADQRNAGNLILQDPRAGVNWVNQFTPYKRVPVEEGLLVMHPGYLLHFVEPTDYSRPIYDYRLAMISSIHRSYEEFLKVLEDNEDLVNSWGANGVRPEEN